MGEEERWKAKSGRWKAEGGRRKAEAEAAGKDETGESRKKKKGRRKVEGGRRKTEGEKRKAKRKAEVGKTALLCRAAEEGVEFGEAGGGADFVETLLEFVAGELPAGDQGLLHLGQINRDLAGKTVERRRTKDA